MVANCFQDRTIVFAYVHCLNYFARIDMVCFPLHLFPQVTGFQCPLLLLLLLSAWQGRMKHNQCIAATQLYPLGESKASTFIESTCTKLSASECCLYKEICLTSQLSWMVYILQQSTGFESWLCCPFWLPAVMHLGGSR